MTVAKPTPKRRAPTKPTTTIGINIEGSADTAVNAAEGLAAVMRAAYEVRASEDVMKMALSAYRDITTGPIYNTVSNCNISNMDSGVTVTRPPMFGATGAVS